MGLIRLCDRCGIILNDNLRKYNIEVSTYDKGIMKDLLTPKDLCKKCAKDFDKFLEGGKLQY